MGCDWYAVELESRLGIWNVVVHLYSGTRGLMSKSVEVCSGCCSWMVLYKAEQCVVVDNDGRPGKAID